MGLASVRDRVEYLEQFLEEIHGDIDAARESEHGFTAVARLSALAVNVRKQLDDARPQKRRAADLSPAELAARLAAGIRKLDREYLTVIEEALADLRGS